MEKVIEIKNLTKIFKNGRGIKNIDLGAFASIYGGKGHVNASGSPLDKNLHEELIKKIFGDDTKVFKSDLKINYIDQIKSI